MASRLQQFIDQAILCLKDRQFEEAAEFARQAIDISPESAYPYALLGIALSQTDLPDEAADAFKNAIRREHQNPKHHYNLAVHYYRYGWHDHALKAAKQALDLNPHYPLAKHLIARVEADSRQPTQIMPHPPPTGAGAIGHPETPAEKPPAAFTTFTTDQPKPKHSLPWVASLGAVWEALLWGTFIVHGFLFYLVAEAAVQMTLEGAVTMLEGSVAYLLAWGAWMVAWFIDLIDRRPHSAWVVIASTGILLSVPCCALFFTPVVASILFFAYGLGTRARDRNSNPQAS